MAKFLVTGGCGFIGSHLADALVAAGNDVRILDDLSTGRRENAPGAADVMVGDVAEAATAGRAMQGVDGCFHLAAIASVPRSLEDWAGTHRVNLTGAIHIFDAARDTGAGAPVPVVYASSSAIYGDNPDIPLGEDATPGPLSAYGADKLGCEFHGAVAAHVHGVPNTGLRFFNIYGPRQDPGSPYSGVISIFADRMLRGEGVEIHGDGGQMRDFVYIADCVAAILAAMERVGPGAQIFNVASGAATSIADLAAHVGAAAGIAPSVTSGPPRSGDIRVSVGDPARATAALGVTPGIDIGAGLARLIADIRGAA